jgi:uncharacterized protein YceK
MVYNLIIVVEVLLLFFLACCFSGCSIVMTDPIEAHISAEEKAFIDRIEQEKNKPQ